MSNRKIKVQKSAPEAAVSMPEVIARFNGKNLNVGHNLKSWSDAVDILVDALRMARLQEKQQRQRQEKKIIEPGRIQLPGMRVN